MLRAYVEVGVGGHVDGATQAWSLDLDHWGLCGQGSDEAGALAALATTAHDAYRRFLARHGDKCSPLTAATVAERIHGDEQAFAADCLPVTAAEVERTLQILRWARTDLVDLLDGATAAELDWDDATRVMPAWATWRTARLMAWHVADAESGYYLAALGVAPPPRPADLRNWLDASARHVRATLPALPADLAGAAGGEVWTTRKVLRRLAWHERGEVDAMRAHLERARLSLGA